MSSVPNIPNVELSNGVEIPQFGFGVFQIERSQTVEAVRTALDVGYRHIDTAQMYGNEAGIGQAVEKSGLPRDEVFITTKLHNDRHGHDPAIAALEESLEKLGTDHVDLYLIHWPMPPENRYVETWTAFEKLLEDGRARAIGVSNVGSAQLERLAERTDTVLAVNQVELHPNFQQPGLRAYHRDHGIATEAWRPIAKGGVFDDRTIADLVEKYGKSPAQVVLRWHIQLGNIVFPKSVTPARIRENIAVFDFEISEDDMARVASLDGDPRGVPSRTSSAGLPYTVPGF